MLPTSADVTVQLKSKPPADADVVVFATQDAKAADVGGDLDVETRRAIERLLEAGIVRGKAKELAFDLIESSGKGKPRRVFVAGLGKPQKVTAETVRQAAGAIAKAARKHRLRSVAIVPPVVGDVAIESSADAIVTGVMLAAFDYREFKGSANKAAKDDGDNQPAKLSLTVVGDASLRPVIDRARVIAEGQNFARTIASRPGNIINPPSLAKVAQELAREVGITCKVMDEKQLARLGMGGILAVGAGSSATPPRMIVLEYRGSRTGVRVSGKKQTRSTSDSRPDTRHLKPVLVVGKAITFDTGGISIKSADKMGDMIYDKSGGMAVLGLMYAAAKLKLPIDVIGILSSAENHISETAYRPGDIVKLYNGVTVEVTNTDAEGRLVLADALAWGIETYKPAAVVDLATLTGGCVVALGVTMAGVMGNDDALFDELKAAADRAGEKVWRLPVGDDQRDQIKSHRADIVNSAGRWASPLQGAAFLSHAIPDEPKVPWMHFDIAGVADTDKELPYYARGSTGWGVRTLVEWVSARAGLTSPAGAGGAKTKSGAEPGAPAVGLRDRPRRR
ncbi:MAG TPA: leucyl aminopeptidase [Tepidisphaeraceae bacterium]|nr:leucyl aminopeptidase [Tepidisphaeraceae bacterium]